ncbi:MAG: hypothetical protein HQK49_05095 [Oligoflexia bacterium]|nr:hypothetical protein [Oligoflexia bacterium]
MTLLLISEQKGFTFMAVMMIVISIGIACSGVVLVLSPIWHGNNSNKTIIKMNRIEQAIILYRADRGITPTSLDYLLTSDGTPCVIDTVNKKLSGWCGPYIHNYFIQNSNEFKEDGWKNTFQLIGNILKSCGPNQICGDADDIVRNI